MVGGITVLTNLNPWVVGLHFLASIGVLARRVRALAAHRRRTRPAPPVVPGPIRQLVWVLTAASLAVIALGVIVTGSGPHAGDVDAHRTGLNPETISQVHADLVFLLIGLSLAVWFAARATGARRTARAALVLVAVELSQGVIGFVQYFTGLPEILVGLHMLGACLVWLTTLSVLWSTRANSGGDGVGEAVGGTGGHAEEQRGLGELQLDQHRRRRCRRGSGRPARRAAGRPTGYGGQRAFGDLPLARRRRPRPDLLLLEEPARPASGPVSSGPLRAAWL